MVQKPEESGQQDILGAFWGENIPFTVQERYPINGQCG